MADKHAPLGANPHITPAELEALHAAAFAWALSRCGGDRAAAEDVLQMTYTHIIAGSARFDRRASLKTWLFGVIRRLAAGQSRRDARWLKVASRLDEPAPAPAPVLPAEHEAVWEAVRALPARQREVIELVFCRDCALSEVAAILGVSVGTVRQHYDRAKKALAQTLEPPEVARHD